MTNITEKAMLVRVSISQWTARKHDARISDEVAAQHGTTRDAGRYNKVLIAKSALDKVAKAAGAARQFHYENTLPWSDMGDARILPSANYFEYSRRMEALQAEFDIARREFIDAYPHYVEEARTRLNGLFDADDYPARSAMVRKFRFKVGVEPLPDASDFRVKLGADEEARIRADIEVSTKAAIDGAVRDLWQRVHDCVSKMAERLSAYKVEMVDGKERVSNPFRDTLVSNLRDLVDLLPRLNLTDDPALARMRDQLADKLCQHEPETLRDNDAVRAQVARDASSLLADMAGYCSAA